MECPCESSRSYAECCGPLIDEGKAAPSAEALMRSRYSAFALQKIDYLKNSFAPECRDSFDEKAVTSWSKNAQWQGLEIVNTEGGQEKDTHGVVEFIAHYTMNGEEEAHAERAEFRKEDGHWYFVDKGEPVRRSEPKLGRNDPCHCGSGKKFKKCHG